MHSIKVDMIPTIVMMIDIAKAYDKVCWLCLRLLLLQIGKNFQIVN